MTTRTSTPIALVVLHALGGCREPPACSHNSMCLQLATVMSVADANLGGYEYSQVTTTGGQTVDFWSIKFGAVVDCVNGCVRSSVCVVIADPSGDPHVLGY